MPFFNPGQNTVGVDPGAMDEHIVLMCLNVLSALHRTML